MNKDFTPYKGFTMIELLIVMAIVALLMSLVGPLTIQGYEKIKAKEEQLALKNWIRANSYRSFATGQETEFVFSQNQVVFAPKPIVNSSLTEQSYEPSTLNTLEQQANPQQTFDQLSFNYLSFEPQKISVNTFGLIFPTQLTLKRNGQMQSIDLSERQNVATR